MRTCGEKTLARVSQAIHRIAGWPDRIRVFPSTSGLYEVVVSYPVQKRALATQRVFSVTKVKLNSKTGLEEVPFH